jgi:hypothetical protein
MFWIRAEIFACPAHGSDQTGFFRALACGDGLVLSRELPLHRSTNQVRFACSIAARSVLQLSTQIDRQSYRDAIVIHILSDIVSDLSDTAKSYYHWDHSAL